MAGQVIEYAGKRGTTFRLRFHDARGQRVIETLPRGTTRKEAERALAARIADVDRVGYTKPSASATFRAVATRWLAEYPSMAQLKPSTEKSYELIARTHLVPAFGSLRMHEIDVPTIKRQMTKWQGKGASGATVNRRLSVLSLIFKAAMEDGIVQANPVPAVRRPKESRQVERPVTPAEVARIVVAFDELIAEEETDWKRDDALVAKRIFVLVTDTAIRRGELLGLKWKHVALADPAGPCVAVAETWVGGQTSTPKSDMSKRRIALDAGVADMLFEHRAWSAFDGEDELVFPNPRTGHPFDVSVYSTLVKRAFRRADIEVERFRPFHGLRRTSITNGAASGMQPHALQKRSGHSSYSVTQLYIDLADEVFADESAKAGARMWGTKEETDV
jgi:integrase